MKKTLIALLLTIVSNLCASAGEVFKPTKIINGEFAPDTEWYTMAISDQNYLLSNTVTDGYMPLTTSGFIGSTGQLWCVVGDEINGYQIYNKAEGTAKQLSAPLNPADIGTDGGEAYVLLADPSTPDRTFTWDITKSNDIDGTGYYINVHDKPYERINNRAGRLAFWTKSADSGSTILFNTIEPDTYFEDNGLGYHITDEVNKIASVNSVDMSHVESNAITIPSTIQHNGVTYTVTSVEKNAFQANTKITSIALPNTITEIKDYTFSGCNSLTHINIPNSVTEIGKEAFRNCRNLISITIPNSVTKINDYAFYNCSRISSFSIPDALNEIGYGVFFGCMNLTEFDVSPANKTFYATDGVLFNKKTELLIAFPSNKDITEYSIPEQTKGIGNYAFAFCGKLTSISIPSSVTAIGVSAFYNCGNLTSITIPNSVTTIASEAFCQCWNLTSVTIPNSITTIGENAFSYCTSLKSVSIPSSVISIGPSAFNECNALTKVEFASIEALCKINFGNAKSNPLSQIHHLYINGTEITNLVIPDSVTYIGRFAFVGCSSLRSVTIPNSITSIGINAFSDCSRLSKVEFASIEALCQINFGNAESNPLSRIHHLYINGAEITNLVIPSSVNYIGSYAFAGCSALTSVTIPNSVTSIGENAFYLCSGLIKFEFTSIEALCKINFDNAASNPLSNIHHLYINGEEITNLEIPKSVTYIGNFAFAGCSGLTAVTIPNSVTSIGWGAFYDCSGITSVTIPNSVTVIGGYAFCDCSGITSVTIPNSVTTIGVGAFGGCSDLTSITIPSSVTVIGGSAFVGCRGLTSVQIPNSVTNINDWTFSGCEQLKSATIPNSVTTIGHFAFSGCKQLKSVVIPNSVTSIRENVFYLCNGLNFLSIGSGVEEIGTAAFAGCDSITELHIHYNPKQLLLANSGLKNLPLKKLYIDRVIEDMPSGFDSSLEVLTIGNNMTSIETLPLKNCSALKYLHVGESVESIEAGTFANSQIERLEFNAARCEDFDQEVFPSTVKTLVVGESVKRIPAKAFRELTEMESAFIGSNVEEIGTEAFYNCSKLYTLTCNAITPPACDRDVFENVDKHDCDVVVPTASVFEYRTTRQWRDFFWIKGGAENDIDEVAATPNHHDAVYHDLQGRRVAKPTRGGIYISGGKKVRI